MMRRVQDGNWPYPRVLAHRCGGSLSPENTLIGLNMAAAHGCRGVEFDVMLSGEGTPYVMHDETFDRTTTRQGRLADAQDAVVDGCDAGSRFDARYSGESVPRFEHVARRCQALHLAANVEIKPAGGQEVETARAVARAAAHWWRNAELPPLLSSFSVTALEEARRTESLLPRGLLVEALSPAALEACARLGAVSLHLDTRRLSRAQVAEIRAGGLWVVAYTENDPMRARVLFNWGVVCVITDRPDLVREHFALSAEHAC